MQRKTFIMTLVAPIIGLFAKVIAGTTEAINQRTVLIYNDDGSTRKANFDELIYADYFDLIEPNGKIVPNGGPWLAITNVFERKGQNAIGVYKEFTSEDESKINSDIMQIVTTGSYCMFRLYKYIG